MVGQFIFFANTIDSLLFNYRTTLRNWLSKEDDKIQRLQGETTEHGALIRCRNDALLVLVTPAAVGSFSFAAIQQEIKKPRLWRGYSALDNESEATNRGD